VLDHRELVDGEPVVVLGIVEVDQPGFVAADAAVFARDFHVHALDDHPVQAAVLLHERGRLGLLDLLDHLLQHVRREVRVEPGQGRPETVEEDHVGIARPLRGTAVRGDVGAMQDAIAEVLQPGEHRIFNVRLGEFGHPLTLRLASTSKTS